MAETKLTDNEIIQILECCSVENCEGCKKDWSYVFQWDCMRHIMRFSLNLIKHLKETNEKNEKIIKLADKTIEKQEAEIERLQNYNDNLRCINTDLSNNLLYEVEQAKSETIEELIKRVKEEINFPLEVWNVFDNIVEEVRG